MKTQFSLRFFHESHRPARQRVAYLLRAARSRRSNNVQRDDRGYYIRDCSVRISPIA